MLTKTLLMILTSMSTSAPEPTAQNFAQWREHIRPKQSELSFESTGWKSTFWEGVVEAQENAKPVLLWAMNGHPLACT